MQLELPKYSTLDDQTFDTFLNEANDIVTICGFSFEPADALKRLDPENYSNLFDAWVELNTKPRLEIVR
jgi:hypothetical protein